MSDYISYKEMPSHLGLRRGGVVFVSSDVTNLGLNCIEHGEKFSANAFIDAFLDTIGPEGTLIFPTYNWGFCQGKTFDYHKTKCETGALGITALKRLDFKRTRHPIYSFAVAGKHQTELCGYDNVSSFGNDSPFAFLERQNAQNVIIGVVYSHCFTLMHYFEQKYGISYRYEKIFTGNYIDENGVESKRSYSKYVRDLDLDVQNDMEEMGKEMESKGVSKPLIINDVPIKIVEVGKCDPLFKDDILNNKSKKICKYVGQ